MLLSPLSATILGLALLGSPDTQALSSAEKRAWAKLEPSVAYILRDSRAVGVAALVERDGTFLAHRSAARSGSVTARLADGTEIELVVKASDPTTQLALLKAKHWPGRSDPLAPQSSPLKEGEKLLAGLPVGTIRAEYVSGKRVGVVGESNRMLPLSEIRFEAPSTAVGGALVTTMDGKIVGFLAATLEAEPTMQSNRAEARNLRGRGAGKGGGRDADAALKAAPAMALESFVAPSFGPADMTVAYAVAPSFLNRALSGLAGPSGQVDYPSIGVLCIDADGGGALVQSVVSDSPAANAGLRTGDVIVQLGTQRIRNQFDVARVVLDQEIGRDLRVTFRRGASRRTATVRVEAQTRPQRRDNPEPAT